MTYDTTLRLLTGDECGVLKEISVPRASPADIDNIPFNTSKAQITRVGMVDTSEVESSNYEQTRKYALHAVVPLTNRDEEDVCWQLATLRSGNGGIVDVYETSQLSSKSVGSFHKVASLNGLFPSALVGTPMGLLCRKNEDNEKLFACDSNGNLAVISVDFESDEDESPLKITHRQNVVCSGNDVADKISQLSSGSPILSAFTASPDGTSLAFGGRSRETFIWDIEKEVSSWKGRNLPPDPQTLLQQPVWGTAMEFIGAGLSRRKDTESRPGHVLAVGSAHKELRIYDIRAQRRPIAHTKEGVIENRVSSLCVLDDSGFHLAVGDSTGDIHNIDLRKMEAVGRFVGPGGSVRQIIRHDSQPIIACVSLDRMLRIYDITSRRMLSKVYLKQRLNCCAFAPGSFMENDNTKNIESQHVWKEGEAYIGDNVQAYVNSSDDEDGESDEDDDGSLMEVGDEFKESESSSYDGNDQEDESINESKSADSDEGPDLISDETSSDGESDSETKQTKAKRLRAK